MRRRYVLLLVTIPLLLFVPSEGEAQRIGDLFWLQYGFGYLSHTADIYDTYNGERVPGRSLHVESQGGYGSIGFYMPLAEVTQESSIGLNADAALWLGSSVYDPAFPRSMSHLDQSDGAIQLAFPLLAMYKSGSDATLEPRSPQGYGLGLGVRPTLIPAFDDFYLAPIVALELSYALEITLMKLRASYTPLTVNPTSDVDLRTLDVGLYFVIGR